MSLSRENIDRWYEELEILKQLDHGNIVKAQNLPEGLDTLTNITGTPFICMEYCDGGDLRQVGGGQTYSVNSIFTGFHSSVLGSA